MIGALIARQDPAVWQTRGLPRPAPTVRPMTSRFCFLRVRAGNEWEKATPSPPREEWLIGEWPDGQEQPTDYWISNLPPNSEPERLAHLARLRWKIELDYKQLKGETRPRPLRRSLLARLVPPHRARHRSARIRHTRATGPFIPAVGLTLPQAVQLFQPIFKCWTGRCQTCQQPVSIQWLQLHRTRTPRITRPNKVLLTRAPIADVSSHRCSRDP